MGKTTSKRPRGARARTVLLALSGVFALLVAAGSGFAIATIRHVESNIDRVDVGPGCERTDPEDCISSIPSTGCDQDLCN